MAFPIFATIGAALGLGGSIINGAGQRAAADAQNRAAQEQAQKRFEFSKRVYDYENFIAMSQWEWDMAIVSQLRELENQYALEQAQWGGKLITSAIKNYELNASALYDEFVVGEEIRAAQEGLQYQRTMQQAGFAAQEAGIQFGMAASRASFDVQQTVLDASQRKAAASLDMLEQTRQYMNSVLENGLQAELLVGRAQNQAKELVETLALEEARDYLGWQLNQVVSIAEGSKTKARSYAMQGGGGTAQRLAAEAAQQLGRRWGELTIAGRSRNLRLGVLNSALTSETANQMGQLALRMQDAADRTKYTMARTESDMQYLDKSVSLSLSRSQSEVGFAKSMFDLTLSRAQSEADFASSFMKSVTIPGFDLASRQYGRELQALQLQTQNAFDEAMIPYRMKPYFDPLKPIPGPAPELIGPTPVQGPSWGSVIANGIVSGFQGAMQFSSMKGGKLTFV